ncbi:hypothetical protein [Paenibacillus sp. MSJ-34]|uniref:hypothetical protein n=1 Tax=Paenibacillus sp. MSJ-34 TaxID=2841529 RepID=UPI001C10D245|nr:hypothetical protein [Paenibacillus sp. MSJ-34]MBU5440784.1 hypothetical protein [Paenibacillus sp. MSJ-34]
MTIIPAAFSRCRKDVGPMRRKLKRKEEAAKAVQPDQCKGCLWGKWAGTTQVCGMPRCVRECW